MASPEVDPLAISDQMRTKSSEILRDSFEMASNLPMLTESDLNLIKKMQAMSSMALSQPKTNGRPVVIPKTVPEILCTCPQKCDEKIPLKVRTFMFKYYHALCRDRPKQEQLLLRFIEMKSLAQRLKEDNKRVQCRYKAPTNMKAIQFIFEDEGVVLSSDEEANENTAQPNRKKPKLDRSLQENAATKSSDEMIALKTDASIRYRIDKNGNTEVCQKAYMNVFLVPEKRVRAVREKLVASKREIVEQEAAQAAVLSSELETAVKIAQDLAAGCKPLLQMLQAANPPPKLLEEDESGAGGGYDISSQLLNAIDSDIELVNNFFYNQLWKPEMFEGFATPKNGAKRGDTPANRSLNGTLNSTWNTNRSVNNTMSSSLLDETFDSVINASASMQDETDVDDSQALNESERSRVDEGNETSCNETGGDPFENEEEADPLSGAEPDSPEDLEVATTNASALLNTASGDTATLLSNGCHDEEPLNLNIAAAGSRRATSAGSPDSSSSRNSPDSSLSKNSSTSQSKYDVSATTAIDLSVSSPHRSGGASTSSVSSSAHFASSKSKSSHRNGHHRSEPMRQNSSKSSPSIQNILNNFQNNFFAPASPSLASPGGGGLFDPDLSKYLSGLESSISITANGSSGSRSGRHRHTTGGSPGAAALTAQLIQNALNQSSSLSVTANSSGAAGRHMDGAAALLNRRRLEGAFANHRNGGSRRNIGTKYSGTMTTAAQHASTLNQILNIPDSVSITPTLVDNSSKS